MVGLVVSLACASVVIAVLLLSAFYAYKSAFYAKGSAKNVSGYFKKSGSLAPLQKKIDELVERLEQDRFEDIYIDSHDGLRLRARYYHIKDGAPVHILMHGYKGNPDRSMCGSYFIAKYMGHNVLIVDQRGCGKSEGKAITFGVKEKRDALSWIEYIINRFGSVPIFLVGISLGGATVLMTSDMSLPKNVVGIMADCPFSSPRAILKKVCREHGMPSFLYPIVTLGALVFGHFNPNKDSAIKSVQSASVPILLLHGKKDGFVPYSMSEEIFNACRSEKYIYSFEDADHAVCYMTDSDKYENAVKCFAAKCLNC